VLTTWQAVVCGCATSVLLFVAHVAVAHCCTWLRQSQQYCYKECSTFACCGVYPCRPLAQLATEWLGTTSRKLRVQCEGLCTVGPRFVWASSIHLVLFVKHACCSGGFLLVTHCNSVHSFKQYTRYRSMLAYTCSDNLGRMQ
jgi:hypothetical protein